MRRSRKRTLLMVLLLLTGGAIINVAVAWGCAAMQQEIIREASLVNAIWVAMGAQQPRRCAFETDIDPQMSPAIKSSFGGVGWRVTSSWSNGTQSNRIGFGWPTICRSRQVSPAPEWLSPSTPKVARLDYFDKDSIHFWPGFAINTIFYAAMLWLLFATPGFVKRRIRARRDQCPACAYPVGASDVCTECGAGLPRGLTKDTEA